MTNTLVGDVYAKIIEEVIASSTADFEESGISQSTLQALQQEWQVKLSQRGVAQMPWDPKPVQPAPAPPAAAAPPAPSTNGLPSSSYTGYDTPTPAASTPTNGARVKAEPGPDPQYNAAPNGFPQPAAQPQGGIARAQQLVQAQYGQAASASLNAMQRGGLALPGQPAPQSKPQGLQLPQQGQPQQPRIKTESGSPTLNQGAFQQTALPTYSQTDGADEDSLEQWKIMLEERRAISADSRQRADHMMHDHVVQISTDLQSGLMLPMDEQSVKRSRQQIGHGSSSSAHLVAPGAPTIPQLDGDVDDDEKPIKDEDDENAINSDLDDSDSDGRGPTGEDDDEYGDEILCTYDKVQRVKNKWKCTLKDGIMSASGRDWVFHKGTGEFEW